MVLGNTGAIDSRTVMYGVFGDPIAHSKSPLMLNAAFREMGLNAAYAAFHILPGTLRDAVSGIRAMQFRGVNVTIPHKVEVMDYLDEIDDVAQIMGAVNTIVNDSGTLRGFNTDGIGYVRSLWEETGFVPDGKRVLMIGAGGAARGIAYALAKEGASCIWIANRTLDRAEELARLISNVTEARSIGLLEMDACIDEVDLVVNTTKFGMYPDTDSMPIQPELLHSKLLVSDIVYNPLETRLLREAKARGARTHGGLGMFVYQGAYAFEYWTGMTAPVRVMREVVEQSLIQERR